MFLSRGTDVLCMFVTYKLPSSQVPYWKWKGNMPTTSCQSSIIWKQETSHGFHIKTFCSLNTDVLTTSQAGKCYWITIKKCIIVTYWRRSERVCFDNWIGGKCHGSVLLRFVPNFYFRNVFKTSSKRLGNQLKIRHHDLNCVCVIKMFCVCLPNIIVTKTRGSVGGNVWTKGECGIGDCIALQLFG